jgi:hypothetical protein
MFKKLAVPAAILATPLAASAASGRADFAYFNELLGGIYNILTGLIPIIIGIAVIMFLWGLVGYMTTSEGDKKKSYKSFIFTGVIVLFVMTTLWGIIRFLRDILSIDSADPGNAPGIPKPGSAR